MKLIKSSLIALMILAGASIALPIALADPVSANAAEIMDGANAANSGGQTSIPDAVENIVNILLFIIGAVAVVVIIIGGIMYATSAGDPGRAKKAKDAILYAVVGLVVAILAYAIVNFVVSAL